MLRILALVLLLCACGAPESIEFGYGHTWNYAGTAYNTHQTVGIQSGDSDTGWVAVTFPLGSPKKAPNPRERVMPVLPQEPEPKPKPVPPVVVEPPPPVVVTPPPVDSIMGWLRFLDTLGNVLLGGLVILVLGFGYWYRLPVTEWLFKVLGLKRKPKQNDKCDD